MTQRDVNPGSVESAFVSAVKPVNDWDYPGVPEEPVGFAPTGTHADVLEAAGELHVSLRSDATVGLIQSIGQIWKDQGAGVGLPPETMAKAWSQSIEHTLTGSGGVWISPLVTDMIEDLAEQLPGDDTEGLHPLTMEDTGLPLAGIVLFGRPIRDQSSNGAADNLWLTGLAWSFFSEMTKEQAKKFRDSLRGDPRGDRWLSAPESEANHTAGVILTPLIVTDQIAADDENLSRRMLARANGGRVMPTMPTSRPGTWWDLSVVTNAEDVSDAAQWIPRLFAALTMWMRSRIVESEQIDRTTTKRVGRRTKAKVAPKVQTVKLRRIERAPDADPVPTGRTRKPYSHRFIVGPFPRNQRCGPGLSEVRRIMVGPFVKGPDGLPIRYKNRIIKVDR